MLLSIPLILPSQSLSSYKTHFLSFIHPFLHPTKSLQHHTMKMLRQTTRTRSTSLKSQWIAKKNLKKIKKNTWAKIWRQIDPWKSSAIISCLRCMASAIKGHKPRNSNETSRVDREHKLVLSDPHNELSVKQEEEGQRSSRVMNKRLTKKCINLSSSQSGRLGS